MSWSADIPVLNSGDNCYNCEASSSGTECYSYYHPFGPLVPSPSSAASVAAGYGTGILLPQYEDVVNNPAVFHSSTPEPEFEPIKLESEFEPVKLEPEFGPIKLELELETHSSTSQPETSHAHVNKNGGCISNNNETNNVVLRLCCHVCNIDNLSPADYRNHIAGKTHYKRTRAEEFICFTCDLKVKSRAAYDDHINGKIHKKCAGLAILGNGKKKKCVKKQFSKKLSNATATGANCVVLGSKPSTSIMGAPGTNFGENNQENAGKYFDKPSRKKRPEYKCELCDCKVYGDSMKLAHEEGKRHRRALQTYDSQLNDRPSFYDAQNN